MSARRLGIHIRTGGGLLPAARHALEIGCNTFQIMSGNPSAWNPGKLDPEMAEEFKGFITGHDLVPVFLHAGYLINLSCRRGRNAPIYAKSIKLLKANIDRAVKLGCAYVVFHLGSKKETSDKEARAALVDGICSLQEDAAGLPGLLLENSAGAGHLLGSNFEELAVVREEAAAKTSLPLGVCLDTAHLWGAGYDISSAAGTRRVIADFDGTVGLDHLKLVHFNDAAVGLGSKKDKHEHPGAGVIPLSGLKALARLEELGHVPFIMETPGETEPSDKQRMKDLRGLAGA